MKILELSNTTVVPLTSDELEDNKKETQYSIGKRINEKKFSFFGKPLVNTVYHEGYLGYLAKAWENHYSIVLRPDDIWYIILNEITAAVAKNPTAYANLFTTTPDKKQLVMVPTGDPETINPDLVIGALKDRVPTKVEDFLPLFSTSTPMSRMAMNVSFCDMVSPFYSYGTFMCGIPRIRIEGTIDDWRLIMNKLSKLLPLFTGNVNTYIQRCLVLAEEMVVAIEGSDANYFGKMVKLTQCGSGHQFEMNGWIMRLLNRKDFTRPLQLEGLPPHFSHMDYFNLETARKFSLYCGLFYSRIENEFMVPEYDAIRVERTKTAIENPPKPPMEEMTLTSTPIVAKNKKLSATWTADVEQGFIYAPYISRYRD